MMQVVVKTRGLTTTEATCISFEKKLPGKGTKSRIIKDKIRREWVNKGYLPLPLPLIFVKPDVLDSISKKLNKKPVTIEIDIKEALSFNSLKEKLIQMYTQ